MANPIHALYPPQEARLAFGRTLTLWLERGGWSHDIPLRWGKAADFPTVADSTFNKLQRGKIEQPYPVTFIQLGLMNARLAKGDYGPIEDQALKERIARQKPITHEDGDLWVATDFFAHFIGEEPAPAWARQRPLPTEQEATARSNGASEQFRSLAAAHELSLPQAWHGLAAHVASMRPRPLTGEELEVLRTVLSGWHLWTPQQLQALVDVEGVMRAELALSSWAKVVEEGPTPVPPEPPDRMGAKAKAAPSRAKAAGANATKPATKAATKAKPQARSKPKPDATSQSKAPQSSTPSIS